MTTYTQLRREPKQRRGQERVELILDATQDLFGELGVDAITTNHIADRAGVDIGSVYYFFNDKFQIFQSILERAGHELSERLDEFASTGYADLDAWTNGFIDVVVSFWQREILACQLLQVLRARPEMLAMIEEQDEINIAILSEGLARYCPGTMPSRRRRAARTTNVMLWELLQDASTCSTARERNAMMREARIAVHAYIQSVSDTPASTLREVP